MTPVLKVSFKTVLFGAFITLFAAQASACNVQAEQQKIREVSKRWVAAVARKDTKAIGNLYTADGMFFPPNSPRVDGQQAIEKAWGGLLKLPGVTLTFQPTRIDISKACDMGVDIGTYELGFDTKKGRVKDRGKYVVVWKKTGDIWKAFTDIFNTSIKAP